MCKYCESIKPDDHEIYGELGSKEYDCSPIGVYFQDLIITNYDDEHGDIFLTCGFTEKRAGDGAYIECKINYCPMCGRKLRGD